MIPFDEINAVALPRLADLCHAWFPAGRLHGVEFVVGNLAGDPGRSLSINVRTGVWRDFASTEGGSDPISLLAARSFDGNQAEAARELGRHLGIIVNGAASSARPTVAPAKTLPPEEWLAILPVPADAPPPPSEHFKFGAPAHVAVYRDAEGRLLGLVHRYQPPNERKVPLPLSFCERVDGRREWRWQAFPKPRPLYRAETLTEHPDAPVLVVEGEPKADEAGEALGGRMVTVGWPGGARAALHADWQSLAGRRVVVWPDADHPGQEAAAAIAAVLRPIASSVVVLTPPAGVAEGWDVADAVAEGWNEARLLEFIGQAEPDLQPNHQRRPEHELPPLHHEDPAWQKSLQRDERGQVLGNLANAALALRHAPELAGLLAFDELDHRVVLKGPVPGARSKRSVDAPLQDADLGCIQEWLQLHDLRRLGKETTTQAVDLVAREAAFHPIRQYLAGLVWDGMPRIGRWLAYHCGAEPTPYTAAIGRLFLIGMVARVMNPGCKLDHMIVLEGQQNAGKSTVCSILAGRWFSDSLPDLHQGDAVRISMHLRGKWLIEIAEMSSIGKAEAGALKAFLTQREERYTPKFGRNEVVEPRQCVFVGTTNKSSYLRDETGNRRFWPIKTGRIDLEALAHDRDALFAEALTAFHAGERWWPDVEFERQHIAPEQEQRFESDAWEGGIIQWLEPRSRCTIPELARECLCVETGRLGTVESRRITAVLERLGWVSKRNNSGRWWERAA